MAALCHRASLEASKSVCKAVTMSVAGFDVGNSHSCVALARKRGIDVIMNSESKRETPAVVSFTEKQRFVGVDGAARLMMNVKNTVTQIKRLIGRKFSDPVVQEDLKDLMFKVEEAPDGGCLISVMYMNEPRKFTPIQVMTSLLKDLKAIAEKDQGSAITDCVIAVPAYYTESERLAMLNSASLAGLKCLRLMNESTATALNWGIFKQDLPEDKPLNVAFVDVGHASLQVGVVAFKKGAMEVKAHTWDRSLGGRDLDNALLAHFASEFKAKTGLDVYSNAKARFRMKTQIEKTRQTLTVNPEALINIECLMDDMDFSSKITREQFEELAMPVLERVRGPCLAALEQAGLTAPDVASVELVGAASRTPAITKTVADVFQQEPKRTMNSKECVSRGCSLQCAMLSPIFQVRNFDVKDTYPFKVEMSWEKDGSPATAHLFGAKDGTPQAMPCVKTVKFFKDKPFSVTLDYSADSDIGAAHRRVAELSVNVPEAAPAGATEVKAVALQFELDLHGLVACSEASQGYKIQVAEPAKKAADKTAEASPAPASKDGAAGEGGEAGAAPMDTESAQADGGDDDKGGAAAAAAPTVKEKSRKRAVPFTASKTVGVSAEAYQKMLEEEGQMAAADTLQRATEEAKNTFEEYIYSLRSKVQGQHADFVEPGAAETLCAELQNLEDWLYEDGEDESKSVYESKYKELRAKGDPIALRFEESMTRDPAAQALSNYCNHSLQWCSTSDDKFAHIPEADRDTVRSECNQALQWLEEKLKAQGALKKWEAPAVTTAEIQHKAREVENVCQPIMTRPAPAPAKAEAPPADAKDGDTKGEGEPMDVDKQADSVPAEAAMEE